MKSFYSFFEHLSPFYFDYFLFSIIFATSTLPSVQYTYVCCTLDIHIYYSFSIDVKMHSFILHVSHTVGTTLLIFEFYTNPYAFTYVCICKVLMYFLFRIALWRIKMSELKNKNKSRKKEVDRKKILNL